MGMLPLSLAIVAQDAVDQEMQRLIGQVASLRKTNAKQQKAAWEKASAAFANDKAWTIMDEITPDINNECRLTDKTVRWFALNRMLTRHMGYEETKVRGEFNNGEDPNFNYSLIECSVKAKATVSYDLKSREGKQVFVIMPFETAASAKMEVTVKCKGKGWQATGNRHADGNIYVMIPASQKVTARDVLTLSIKNNGSKNMAFVILNHNTRNK